MITKIKERVWKRKWSSTIISIHFFFTMTVHPLCRLMHAACMKHSYFMYSEIENNRIFAAYNFPHRPILFFHFVSWLVAINNRRIVREFPYGNECLRWIADRIGIIVCRFCVYALVTCSHEMCLYIKRNGVTYESMWHSLSVDVSSNAINRISHCLSVTKDEPRN